MHIYTTRFGAVQIDSDDILLFPNGLIGFEDIRHWVLLADQASSDVGWLQSVSRPETALAVVSPRKFSPQYSLRVERADIEPLQLSAPDRAFVLAVVSKDQTHLTLNLKSPLVLNLERCLGRQVVTNDDQPLRLELVQLQSALRKSA